MANVTITGLPNATTPLAGTERLPMDQAGVTVDATAQDVANLAPPATIVRKLVRNNSGVPIPKGAAVYQTGSSGTTITVALADATDEATAAQTLGLAQEAIANNANGYIVAVGLLDGISTATLTEGQVVWLSETAGQLTTTRPTQPAHGVVCGYCVKQGSGASGILYVKIDNGLELYELHDVLINSPTAGQVLRRASDGLWKNATLAAADVSGLGTLATQSGTFSGTSSGTNTGDVSLAASVADVLSLSGQELQADDPGADRLLFWDDSAGKLRHLTLGTNLSITDTTLDATGGSTAGEVRCDGSAVTTIYVGRAAANTAESATGWTITRTTYSALGVLQTTTTASGAWTNRTSLTYS